jgi:GDP-D-mannose 3', 5'-epimerase
MIKENMSKVYITGVAGMIGSVVAAKFVNSGFNVVGVDNFWRGRFENLLPMSNKDNFEFRLSDLRFDDSWAEDITKDDTIIHVADIVAGIGYVFDNEFEVYKNNCQINTAVAALVSRKCPQKVIYLGTACSYPQSLQQSVSDSQLKESDKFPAEPESGYGWSKLMGQVELQLVVKNSDTQLVILDLHNVYGWPSNYWDTRSQVIPALIGRAKSLSGQPLTVWGDGHQARAFVHVNDVARAIMLAFDYQGDEDNFMIGPNYCTTIKDVASIIINHESVKSSELIFDTTKPTGDIGRFADYSLAKNHLGWEPKVSLEEGVNDLIVNILEHTLVKI